MSQYLLDCQIQRRKECVHVCTWCLSLFQRCFWKQCSSVSTHTWGERRAGSCKHSELLLRTLFNKPLTYYKMHILSMFVFPGRSVGFAWMKAMWWLELKWPSKKHTQIEECLTSVVMYRACPDVYWNRTSLAPVINYWSLWFTVTELKSKSGWLKCTWLSVQTFSW